MEERAHSENVHTGRRRVTVTAGRTTVNTIGIAWQSLMSQTVCRICSACFALIVWLRRNHSSSRRIHWHDTVTQSGSARGG